MHEEFKNLTDGLNEQLHQLLQMMPLTLEQPIRDSPKGGVYLFSENGVHLYVGRTKRHFANRLKVISIRQRIARLLFDLQEKKQVSQNQLILVMAHVRNYSQMRILSEHTKQQRDESKKWKFDGFRSLIQPGRLCWKSTSPLR